MDISNIIEKKLLKKRLNESDFLCVINGYLNDEVSETQMVGFLKAITDNNLNNSEIYALTKAMQNAGGGKTLDLKGRVADKHSTGGVSDSTTLLVVPIVAAAGVKILKMSGKSLGFTGGTADKILCFERIKNDIPTQEALRILNKTNGCFLTQSDEIAPADKKIYALRDKIGLIASIPLIASSIVSKKLASGGHIIVFDVKVGQGAFIKTLRDAVSLAKIMIDIVKKEGKKACAVISSMDEPLGNFIGDCLEVREAIEILKNAIKPLNPEHRQSSNSQSLKYASSSFRMINVSTLVSNLKEEISKSNNGDKNGNNLLSLSETLSALIIKFAQNIELEDAKRQVRKVLGNGKALTKLKEIIREQGGSLNLFNKKIDYINKEISLDEKGYIKNLDTENLGLITKEFTEKYKDFAGIEILVRRGDKVSPNIILARLYFKKDEIDKTKISKKLIKKETETKQKMLNEIIKRYKECFKISPKKTKAKSNIIRKIIY